jgi:hypothetical protein
MAARGACRVGSVTDPSRALASEEPCELPMYCYCYCVLGLGLEVAALRSGGCRDACARMEQSHQSSPCARAEHTPTGRYNRQAQASIRQSRRAGRAGGQGRRADTVKQQAGSRISARATSRRAQTARRRALAVSACGERRRRAQAAHVPGDRPAVAVVAAERRGPWCVASACYGAAGAGRAGGWARHLAHGLRPAAQQGGSSQQRGHLHLLLALRRLAVLLPEDAVAGCQAQAGLELKLGTGGP